MNQRQVEVVLQLVMVLGLFGVVAFGSGTVRLVALVALLVAYVVYRRLR